MIADRLASDHGNPGNGVPVRERRTPMAIERWRPGFDLMRGPFRELRRLEQEMEELFGK